jgi:carbon storage regulator
MLVLTRKVGERIQIGADITVTVVRIEGNKIRIGIEAPTEIPIKRTEPTDDKPMPRPTSPTNSSAARLVPLG